MRDRSSSVEGLLCQQWDIIGNGEQGQNRLVGMNWGNKKGCEVGDGLG